MPYSMSHLYIAQTVLEEGSLNIDNVEQYYLGTLAPDAVHFRKNYDILQKRISHLYENLERDYLNKFIRDWENNLNIFFLKHKSKDNKLNDFLSGYCIHIMADIYNYQYIWTPFKHKYGKENESKYQKECLLADYKLYEDKNYEEKLFPILKKSFAVNFYDIIKTDEIEKLKDNILNIHYKNRPKANYTDNEYITYDKMNHNNCNTVNYIIRLVQQLG
jgi:hypothetical protein